MHLQDGHLTLAAAPNLPAPFKPHLNSLQPVPDRSILSATPGEVIRNLGRHPFWDPHVHASGIEHLPSCTAPVT